MCRRRTKKNKHTADPWSPNCSLMSARSCRNLKIGYTTINYTIWNLKRWVGLWGCISFHIQRQGLWHKKDTTGLRRCALSRRSAVVWGRACAPRAGFRLYCGCQWCQVEQDVPTVWGERASNQRWCALEDSGTLSVPQSSSWWTSSAAPIDGT